MKSLEIPLKRGLAVTALCILLASRSGWAQEAATPQVPERIRVGLGAVLFGEWRTGGVGIMSEGSISRLLGETLYFEFGPDVLVPLELPDVWMFNIGIYPRLYPMHWIHDPWDWLYVGPGVAV